MSMGDQKQLILETVLLRTTRNITTKKGVRGIELGMPKTYLLGTQRERGF